MADDKTGRDSVTDLHRQGLIRNQEGDVQRDPGQELLEEYNQGDAYEKDKIELRGIVYFALGLVILCGVTFGLMALLQQAMEVEAKRTDTVSPMAMKSEENLPPEPRLQAAPGFGVERENGARESLELREPQSEYRALRRDWEKVWREGRKDPKTGTVINIPIDEAKQKVVQQGIGKTRPAEQSQKTMETIRLVPAYSSSGRTMEIRRQ